MTIREHWQRIYSWFDDHATKTLGAVGASLVVTDITGMAEPIKYVFGEIVYKLILGAAFGATFWRGIVAGRKHNATLAELDAMKQAQTPQQ